MLILALDFGGTKLSAAIPAADQKSWRAHERVYSRPGADATADLENILGLAGRLLAGRKPDAIGVSFGGPVNYDTGEVRLSHHVPGWESVPLKNRLEAHFGAPAVVDNDANAGALGEYDFGAGAGCSSLLFVTVSTGVGGGWVLNGGPWRGRDGMAGEIGHTVVDPAGPLCLCGKRGCVERLASGPYMARDALEQLQADPSAGAILRRQIEANGGSLTGILLSRAAAAGDPLACAVLERGAHALGVGLGNAANLVNPERILLGGGVTHSGPIFWDTVRQAARTTALPEVHVEILPAALGDAAPLWGAVGLANRIPA